MGICKILNFVRSDLGISTDHQLKKKDLRVLFTFKEDDATECYIKLYDEELHNLYSS
jgi:hypothetical protein